MTLREKIAEIITESWYEANELVSADRILALMEEKDKDIARYREALKKIVKHMEYSAGNGYHLSTVYNIAKSALQNEGEGK